MSAYYVPCCGNNCAYGYIISMTDLFYCPGLTFEVYINGYNLFRYNACGVCSTIYHDCYFPNCTDCCEQCWTPDGFGGYSSTYTYDYSYARFRTASSIAGGAPDTYGSGYTTFSVCNPLTPCGCSLIKSTGTNIMSIQLDPKNYIGAVYKQTLFRIEKVQIGGGVVSYREGSIIRNGSFFQTAGDMLSNFTMSFPAGSLFV